MKPKLLTVKNATNLLSKGYFNTITLNIDPKEISKFSSQAKSRDPPLVAMNEIRVQIIKRIAHSLNKSQVSVLDVGCGNGILAEVFYTYLFG